MDYDFEVFLDKTLNNIDKMYDNDEFRDGYADAVEAFKNAILCYFEEKRTDVNCIVLEFDPDYDGIVDILEYIGEEIKGKTVEDYCSTSWNNSYFYILLLKKD